MPAVVTAAASSGQALPALLEVPTVQWAVRLTSFQPHWLVVLRTGPPRLLQGCAVPFGAPWSPLSSANRDCNSPGLDATQQPPLDKHSLITVTSVGSFKVIALDVATQICVQYNLVVQLGSKPRDSIWLLILFGVTHAFSAKLMHSN